MFFHVFIVAVFEEEKECDHGADDVSNGEDCFFIRFHSFKRLLIGFLGLCRRTQ
jgi:hypothetical protein